MLDFVMPSLGADMESATLVEWKVKVGDKVKKGDIIAVVETVKGAIDVEVFDEGTVAELVVQPGTVVAVGGVMAHLDGAGPVRPRVSPRERKAAAATPAAPAAPPPHSIRDAIAAAMSRSKREIPHYYLQTTIDVGAAMAWLEAENGKRPVAERLLPAALLLKATALALREVPELNGTFDAAGFKPSAAVNLGVAISLKGGGLVAPAIHDAAALPLAELMARLLDLVARTRSGGLRSSELSEGTVTVTNLGDLGVEGVLGVIYPPQVALVGFGKIQERPWVREGRVEVRKLVSASLSADHRVSDGHRGGLFLTALDRLLQTPETL